MVASTITSSTGLYALIGDPVEHSLSPAMHNAAFHFLNLNNVYLCFRVKSEDIGTAIMGMRSLGIHGFNVTIPHKLAVMHYLDDLDPLARDIGAVNTVVNQDGRLIGYNTDGLGALKALEDEGINLQDKKVVIIGAGGTGKAISYSIIPFCKTIVILNRTRNKAFELASELRKHHNCVLGGELSQETLSRELKDTDVLIHTTPVGMSPQTSDSLVEKTLLHPSMVVFDVIYTPLKTQLLRRAKEVGAKPLGGLSMLVHQGALAFKLWTDREPPIKLMSQTVERALVGI